MMLDLFARASQKASLALDTKPCITAMESLGNDKSSWRQSWNYLTMTPCLFRQALAFSNFDLIFYSLAD